MARRRRPPPRDRRHRAGRGLLPRTRCAARRRRARALRRAGRPRPERDAVLGAADALLHLIELRRAVRLRDGRGDGVRDAGRRAPARRRPEVVADGRPAGSSTTSTRAVRAVGRLGDARPARRAGRACEERFSVERMVDGLPATSTRIGGSEPAVSPPVPTGESGSRSCRRGSVATARALVGGAVRQDQVVAVQHRPARVHDVGHVAVALVVVGLEERLAQVGRGCASGRRGRAAAPRCGRCRIGPTPWVRTSQPASVSIGEPQLPSLDGLPRPRGRLQQRRRPSHKSDVVGARAGGCSPGPAATARRSCPSIRAREQRHPLVLRAPLRRASRSRRCVKSLVSISCGRIAKPSYAV